MDKKIIKYETMQKSSCTYTCCSISMFGDSQCEYFNEKGFCEQFGCELKKSEDNFSGTISFHQLDECKILLSKTNYRYK